ncbi:MAG: hypothetical protein JWP87_2094 [Labilithrix sp.]|nr:hypothetical protein [Labilithrix sp.]
MRFSVSSSFGRASFGIAVLGIATSSCAAFAGDAARDARLACDKKDGPSCFVAGNLVTEKSSGVSGESVRLWIRGCAVRHSPSCDALGNVKGPLREQALVGGCNAGDLVSCAKRADELTQAGNVDEARGLRHEVCKKSSTISSGTPAREVEGIAEACASLARMISAGQGGGRDDVAAAKLDVLAMTLRNEALYRHEREDDTKQLPAPSAPEPEPPRRKSNIKKAPKVDPLIAEREKFRREYEARRAAREAWMTSVQTTMTAASQQKERGDPSIPTPTAIERATAMMPTANAGPSQCQACVESCGSMARCTADEFSGGRCGHLRCPGGGPCPDLDACVAECAGKAEICTKACGDCAEPNKSEAPKAVKQ